MIKIATEHRDREGERKRYIYVYIEREGERERERDAMLAKNAQLARKDYAHSSYIS